MFKGLVISAMREIVGDLYKKLYNVTASSAEMANKLHDLVEHVSENRESLNMLIQVNTQVMEALSDDSRARFESKLPDMLDIYAPPDPDDDLIN